VELDAQRKAAAAVVVVEPVALQRQLAAAGGSGGGGGVGRAAAGGGDAVEGATAGVCGDNGWPAAGGFVFSDGTDGPPDFGSGCPLLVSGNAVFRAGPGVAGGTGCG